MKTNPANNPAATSPRVMGILNVTPDSFSDGGSFIEPDAALRHATAMIHAGAGIIDVGPESSRPGSKPVDADEQIRRAVQVIERIHDAHPDIDISIDTRLSAVAAACLQAGATMINDISALRDDDRLVEVVANADVPICLMHMRGRPPDMQQGGGPVYDDVVTEVCSFLKERAAWAIEHGIKPQNIILDPGIGFGKRDGGNLALLCGLPRLVELGFPVLVGASRKRFIGRLLDLPDPPDRKVGSITCALWAARAGAAILRVHDVAETVQSLKTWAAINAGGTLRLE